jgi:subtilase family serine protease
MSCSKRCIPLALLSIGMAAMLPAQTPGADALLHGRVALRGNVHPAVLSASPLGRCDPAMPMTRMLLALKPPSGVQVLLDQRLLDLQNPASPSYHQWLTPEQFAQNFGPAPAQIAQVTDWLRDQGFTVDEVARGGLSIEFSGNVEAVERAFLTPMMNYQSNGRSFHANASDPSIPSALGDLVAGVVSLHNLPRRAMHKGARKLTADEVASLARPQYTYNGSHYLSPGDFGIIYNVNPLYASGINGQGVTIAIVGRTHPKNVTLTTGDWAVFRSTMGLSANAPVFINNGTDPGDLDLLDPTNNAGEDMEADLDVEWSGAVAPNATIKFVCSATTNAQDGADLSAQYIVDNNLAPILSSSFGDCESDLGTTGNTFYANLWSQAAAEGITVFVASGDDGAAGCYDPGPPVSVGGQAVSGLASTPYNVAVGGTQFNEGGSTLYWSATNSSNGQGFISAQSYIPEVVWNESTSSAPDASGGGASTQYAKPSWQAAPGVPVDGHRDLPDVSLSSDDRHDPYLVQAYLGTSAGGDGNDLYSVGGTSCAAPAFAGIMALLEQHNGQRQGNPNTVFYQLFSTQHSTGAPVVFHMITQGNNSVTGVTGFTARPDGGYNQATGLGSVDANVLVRNWGTGVAVSVTPSSAVGLLTGRSLSFTAAVTGTLDTGVTWTTTGGTLTPGNPSTTATFSATVPGTYTITAAPPQFLAEAASVTVYVHGANFLDTAVSGLDVLDLVGHYGTSDPALDLTGDSLVGAADLKLILQQLGW